MLGVVDLWTYVLGVIFIVLVPGPNSLYVLGVATRYGKSVGCRAAGGIVVGDAVLMCLASMGATTLLRTNPHVFTVAKFVGAAYLLWMGGSLLYGLWRERRSSSQAEYETAMQKSQLNKEVGPFRGALLLSLFNPKAILFFLSFFVQFVDPNYPYPALSFIFLGTVLQIASVTYLSLLIFLGMRLAAVFSRKRWLTLGAGSTAGMLFIGFGVKLATASLG